MDLMMPLSKSEPTQVHSETFEAIGTSWHIETKQQLTNIIVSEINALVESFDTTYSRFRADSLVTKLSQHAGTYTFPENVIPLMRFYRKLYEITDGRMTPLIGSMLEKAGYDATYSFKASEQVPLAGWDEVMQWKNTIVTTARPITLDIGAAGKGYLIDSIALLLDNHHITEYAIDASGDISCKGTSEHIIGLEHPNNPQKVIGTVRIQNQSICASAVNRRKWGNGMHHIFDPTTKAPTREIIATWVIAQDAMTADGLATALFFTDPAKLAAHYNFQYVRMRHDGSVQYSAHLNGELYP
jgi:thiamine biosynthesis lipoprotein